MQLPKPLASLVVKDGVGIGLLSPRDRELVLALAARALAEGRDHSEAQVNELLAEWLDGTGSMLRTDHVELRRWLIDGGFVSRDGFGRVYRREEAQVVKSRAVFGDAPAGSIESAIAALRAERSADRDARRRAFETARGTASEATQA